MVLAVLTETVVLGALPVAQDLALVLVLVLALAAARDLLVPKKVLVALVRVWELELALPALPPARVLVPHRPALAPALLLILNFRRSWQQSRSDRCLSRVIYPHDLES